MRQSSSTQSLHTGFSSILKQQSQNPIFFHCKSNTRLFKSSQASSFYNARGRLNTIREMVTNLQQQMLDGEISNKQMHLKLSFFKQEYLQKRLGLIESDLQGKIKQLKKKVLIGRRSDKLKYESMHNILDGITKNNRQLQRRVFEIEERVQRLQQAMGFENISASKNYYLSYVRYSLES